MRLHIVLVLSACICSAIVKAQSPAAPAPVQSKPASAASVQTQNTKPAKPSAVPADRLDLETTVVSGNRELPKVLYIVPWKKAELGELPAQPFNTLLDEILAPVDRDVFKREVKYFHAVNAAGKAGVVPATAAVAPSGTGSGQTPKN